MRALPGDIPRGVQPGGVAVSEPTSDRPAYFDQLTATVEEIRRLRWTLRQVCALADDAPTITDQQLRDRLLALASCAR
jgi:hypothetical protein